jgi:hypothetical protein
MQFGTDQLADRLQAERMAMDMRLQMAGSWFNMGKTVPFNFNFFLQ